MYCYNCGSPISEEALRQKIGCCSVCGAPIMAGNNNGGYRQPRGVPYAPPYPQQPVAPAGTQTAAADGKEKKALVIVLSVVIGALLLVAVLLMVRVFTDGEGKNTENRNAAASETVPATAEEKTPPATEAPPPAKYAPGTYKNVTQSTVNLRAAPSAYSARLLMVGWSQVITVTEVYEDTAVSDETLRWWGKTNVSGYDGWVALYYFAKIG